MHVTPLVTTRRETFSLFSVIQNLCENWSDVTITYWISSVNIYAVIFHGCLNRHQEYASVLVWVREGGINMLMAADTCEYFTVGTISFSHTQKCRCSTPLSRPRSHVRLSPWASLVKVDGFPCDFSSPMALCESSPYVHKLTHTRTQHLSCRPETTWTQSVRSRG